MDPFRFCIQSTQPATLVVFSGQLCLNQITLPFGIIQIKNILVVPQPKYRQYSALVTAHSTSTLCSEWLAQK